MNKMDSAFMLSYWEVLRSNGIYLCGLFCVFAYTVLAILHDFEKAKVILGIELGLLGFYGILKLDQWSGVLSLGCKKVADVVNEHRFVRIGLKVVWGVAMGLMLLSCVWQKSRNMVCLLGLLTFNFFGYLWSWKRGDVKWYPILMGYTLQFLFALLIIKWEDGYFAFEQTGNEMKTVLDYGNVGSGIVFDYPAVIGHSYFATIPIFGFVVLPTAIFFSCLVSVLYYLGVLPCFVKYVGGALSKTLGTSMAESTSSAGNIFLGAIEAPMLVGPFLDTMTKSELHSIMTGGFATIAGAVMAMFIGLGISPTHLLAASVMSAPAALAVSKLFYPETEKFQKGDNHVVAESKEDSIMEAAVTGTSAGVDLAVNIAAMLMVFVSLLYMLDSWVGYFGQTIGINEASFTNFCGYVFYPVAWLMGIAAKDCHNVAQLIGYKIFINEFVGFLELSIMMKNGVLEPRSVVIATYALCGFSNFATIGIQLGGLSRLAPQRKSDISQLVFSSMIAGNIVCFSTACIAGLISSE